MSLVSIDRDRRCRLVKRCLNVRMKSYAVSKGFEQNCRKWNWIAFIRAHVKPRLNLLLAHYCFYLVFNAFIAFALCFADSALLLSSAKESKLSLFNIENYENFIINETLINFLNNLITKYRYNDRKVYHFKIIPQQSVNKLIQCQNKKYLFFHKYNVRISEWSFNRGRVRN